MVTSTIDKRIEGTFVAYHKGRFRGQSKYRENLYQSITDYYEKTNVAVFCVPESSDPKKFNISKCFGEF